MPRFIRTIIEICLDTGKDALFLTFSEQNEEAKLTRSHILKWLDQQNIGYEECICNISPQLIHTSYTGDLYLNVRVAKDDEKYRCVCDYLEDHCGEPKFPHTQLATLSVEDAKYVQSLKE